MSKIQGLELLKISNDFKIQVNKVARLGWNDNIRLKTEEHLIRSGFKDVDHLDGGERE